MLTPLPAFIFLTLMATAVGGVSWSMLTGTPWYITVPVALVSVIGLLVLVWVARMMPTAVAYRAVRIARSVREPKYTSFYAVRGFVLPIGFWRLLLSPYEYAVVFLICEEEIEPWRKVLRMTRGQKLFETFGWGMEAICRHALKQDDPAAVIAEAKSLATEYPPFEVGCYAGHPAGARRGFELLRAGIPYEFGELLA